MNYSDYSAGESTTAKSLELENQTSAQTEQDAEWCVPSPSALRWHAGRSGAQPQRKDASKTADFILKTSRCVTLLATEMPVSRGTFVVDVQNYRETVKDLNLILLDKKRSSCFRRTNEG